MPAQKPSTVDQYFATVTATAPNALSQLKAMREIIKKAAPKAEEVINYSMPSFKVNGIVVWYAAFKQHIGLYPRPSAIQLFAKDLAKYATSKGAIQFPLDQPLPSSIITKIVKFRLQEDAAEAAGKAAKKAAKKKSPAKKTAPKKKVTASKKAPAKKSPAAAPKKSAARTR